MSRGTSKPKLIHAVLAGMAARDGVADPYTIAESVVRLAQPCRVDVGLDLSDAGKRAAINHEVRVLGLSGGVKATVLAAIDAKPASVVTALRELRSTARRRSEGDAYRMLALQLDGDDEDAGLAKLKLAMARELGSRAASAEIVVGEPLESAHRTVRPAVVVLS